MASDLAALLPTWGTVTTAVLAFAAGATAPTYYAQERMRGFGRSIANRIPYTPPPGMSEQQALEAAQEAAEGVDAAGDDGDA